METSAYPIIAILAAILIPIIIFSIVATVIEIIGLWFVFEKAGEPGWAAIIPIYNLLITIKIAGKPWWWLLLGLIPLVNLIFYILVLDGLSKSFGKSSKKPIRRRIGFCQRSRQSYQRK